MNKKNMALLLRILGIVAITMTVPASNHGGQGSNSTARTIPIGVFTQAGMFVEDAQAENFKAKGVSGFKLLGQEKGPRRILLLIDNSFSMKVVWNEALLFCHDFSALLSEGDSVALAVCGTQNDVFFPFTSDLESIPRITGLVPRPGAPKALISKDAIKKSITRAFADEIRTYGDAVILISDAAADGALPDSEFNAKERAAFGARVFYVRLWNPLTVSNLTLPLPLYVPGDDDPSTRSRQEVRIREAVRLQARLAERLAQQTGGSTIDPWFIALQENQGLHPAYFPLYVRKAAKTAVDMIRRTYRVEISVPKPSGQAQSIDIRFVDRDGSQFKGVQILHPQSVMAP